MKYAEIERLHIHPIETGTRLNNAQNLKKIIENLTYKYDVPNKKMMED
jgi:hypothetical protein